MIPFSYDIMQPMYPLLIQQFLDDYNLSAGVALDIGTGPGNLAVELAKVTAMDLILVDIDGEAHRAACLNWGWITEFLPCALMWKNCLYGITWRILSCVVVLSAFGRFPSRE